MYLDYGEYLNFGGNLSNADFVRFCFRAKKELDNATFGRIKCADENIKRCMFELIEFISGNTKNGAMQTYTSVSNDGYSVAFSSQKTNEDYLFDIIQTYLGDTDLLYRGVE